MMTATLFPMRNSLMRPAFWGLDRDLKEVLDSMDNVWHGVSNKTVSEFQETDSAYLLSMDLPGVSKSSLDIQVEGENLVISGVRKRAFAKEDEQEQKITRSFVLPKQVDTNKIEAHSEDGVLYIALPKIEQAKPRKIEIKQDSGSFFQKQIAE